MVMDARADYSMGLKVYKAAGDEIGWLPKPMNISVAFPLADMPSLTFEYMKDSPGANWFATQTQGLEVAVMLWIPGLKKWIEPPNGRFLVLQWEDDVSDDHNIIRFTCPGYAWLLSKALVFERPQDAGLREAERLAKEKYDSSDSSRKSYESNINSTLSSVKSDMKYSGLVFYKSGFPKSVKVNGGGTSIPNRSILYHTTNKKLYWFSSSANRWYLITKKAATDRLPNLNSNYASLVTAGGKSSADKLAYERAVKNAEEATKDGKRPMVRTTAGWVIKRLWDEAKGRGGDRLKGMFRAFNGTYCTGPNGVGDQFKWQTRFDIDLTIGQSILDVLNELVETGQVEWQFRGRKLDLFRPGLYDLDLSQNVALNLGYDLKDAPDTATRHDFANYILVRGEGDLSFGMKNIGADQSLGWGTWEKSLAAAGAKTISDAKKLVTHEAKSSLKRVKVESTRGFVVRPGGLRPMYDFLPGHRVRTYGTDGTMSRVRIMQVTLTGDDEGRIDGNLVLGDRFYRNAIDFRKSLSRTLGGYEKTIGGGSTPMPVVPRPKAPDASMLAPPALAISAKVMINEATGQSGTGLLVSWLPSAPDAVEFIPDTEVPPEATSPLENETDW